MTECRVLKVPRRLSWPESRTGIPSSSKRPERERFRVMPFVGAARFENFAAPIEHRASESSG